MLSSTRAVRSSLKTLHSLYFEFLTEIIRSKSNAKLRQLLKEGAGNLFQRKLYRKSAVQVCKITILCLILEVCVQYLRTVISSPFAGSTTH